MNLIYRRTFLGEPSQRSDDHFDWLINRPNEHRICVTDDIRFDWEGCGRVVRSLAPSTDR